MTPSRHRRELTVPPRLGVDAVAFERGAVGVDGVFLRVAHGEARDVEREVVRELGEWWAGAAHRPVDQHGATVGIAAEVAELPVAVQERLRGGRDRVEERPRLRVQPASSAAMSGATISSRAQPSDAMRDTGAGNPSAPSHASASGPKNV